MGRPERMPVAPAPILPPPKSRNLCGAPPLSRRAPAKALRMPPHKPRPRSTSSKIPGLQPITPPISNVRSSGGCMPICYTPPRAGQSKNDRKETHMPKLKWILCSPLALLLLWMSPSRLSASGDTPIIIKDGGSIILWIQKLDSDNWTAGKFELRHPDTTGTISSVKVTEAGADKCNGDSKCGIDVSNPWRIQVNYGPHSLNLSSV